MIGKSLIRKIYVLKRKTYGRQKMNLIISNLKNEKSLILKTVYGKYLLNFSDFLIFFRSDQLVKKILTARALFAAFGFKVLLRLKIINSF